MPNKPKNIYLIAKYYARPRKPNATIYPGYMKDQANISWDEQITITRGLKNKDLLESKVTLNITTQEVERNSFQNGKPFYELFEYFYKANPQEISRALAATGINVKEVESTTETASVEVPSGHQ
jgi:hypothetical protein